MGDFPSRPFTKRGHCFQRHTLRQLLFTEEIRRNPTFRMRNSTESELVRISESLKSPIRRNGAKNEKSRLAPSNVSYFERLTRVAGKGSFMLPSKMRPAGLTTWVVVVAWVRGITDCVARCQRQNTNHQMKQSLIRQACPEGHAENADGDRTFTTIQDNSGLHRRSMERHGFITRGQVLL
jgi:hypothetical protein